MGTRSDIIVEHADGHWSRIYCHWDGYLEHNGRILAEHYNTQQKAEALVEHGDLSSLAPDCSKPAGHSYDTPVKGYCVYYGRDRGEDDTEAKTGLTLDSVWPEPDTWTEYTYVWRFQQGWSVASADSAPTDRMTPLIDALAGIDVPKPDIKAPWGVIGHRA